MLHAFGKITFIGDDLEIRGREVPLIIKKSNGRHQTC
jgi:hypothetical protein